VPIPTAPAPAAAAPIPRSTALALLFHDAVYDPRAHDNEEASAALAREAIVQLIGPIEGLAAAAELSDRVAALVMRTKHLGAGGEVTGHGHAPESVAEGDAAVALAREGDLVVDADLSVFASRDAAVWDAYEAGVAHEYAWVGHERYREGRLRVLRGFAAKERLFCSPQAAAAGWEAAAKANLTRAIAVLEGTGSS